MRIGDLKSGEKYEADKQTRAQRPAPTGAFDRLAGIRNAKATPPVEIPSATTALTAPDLPERFKPMALATIPPSSMRQAPPLGSAATTGYTVKGPLMNGNTNAPVQPGSSHFQVHQKTPYNIPALAGTPPLKLTSETATDLHLLTKEEADLCSVLHLKPKPYLLIKEGLLKEAMKGGGALKRKLAKEVCKASFLPQSASLTSYLTAFLRLLPKAFCADSAYHAEQIDHTKSSRIFEFFVHSGWIQKG